MVDYHVHIGQWAEMYFPAHWVFDELKANGVEEAWFSSTSSCRYCRESFDVIQKQIGKRQNFIKAFPRYMSCSINCGMYAVFFAFF